MLTAWVKGTFKERINKTMPFALPLNILTFLVGYVYETIKVL